MFKSPSPHLTMEFQGGEPSLEPKLLRYGIELAEEINKTEQREINYVLCTNCVDLTDEVMERADSAAAPAPAADNYDDWD